MGEGDGGAPVEQPAQQTAMSGETGDGGGSSWLEHWLSEIEIPKSAAKAYAAILSSLKQGNISQTAAGKDGEAMQIQALLDLALKESSLTTAGLKRGHARLLLDELRMLREQSEGGPHADLADWLRNRSIRPFDASNYAKQLRDAGLG